MRYCLDGDLSELNYITFVNRHRKRLAGKDPTVKVDVDALVPLFERPWFTRLWVCKLPDGADALSLIWNYVDKVYGRGSQQAATSPMELLSNLSNFQASDPRDYVYGVYGLYKYFSAGTSHVLYPDYTKDTVEFFRDATRAALMEDGSLLVFNFTGCLPLVCGADCKYWKQCPTWVPLWDHSSGCGRACAPQPFKTMNCNGMKGDIIWPAEPYLWDLNVLSVLGLCVGATKSVLNGQSPDMYTSTDDIELCNSIALVLGDMGRCPSEVERMTSLTLVAGHDHLVLPMLHDTAKENFKAWRQYLQEHGDWPPDSAATPWLHGEQGPERRPLEYNRAFGVALSDRVIFLTEQGQLGLGPMSMSTGDILAILWGCPWPVVLRPLQDSDEFSLVGVAYVYGIMSGEAIEEDGQGNVKGEEVFHIR
ncbi:hypothetical protein LTR78_004570 [Recurvomyces mirabilis]|uniref:Uncharacterized protein n=1 Tax=Recurvomyces mirabilis TaxID=574656 RepID=A0AAE1C2B2_9PEZI|nr:hypothetical protein LTR78_004570 [Recurvomyces mirabilis]KAK5152936.1 hypothetical protein LTS14_008044 [Recurvomyces mirabilis]